MIKAPPPSASSSQVSISRIAAFFFIIAAIIVLAMWAKTILVPIVFAVVFALTLRPICNWFESKVRVTWLSIVFTFIAAALPIAGAVLLFSYQTIEVLDDLPTITEEFQESINRVFIRVSETFDLSVDVSGYDWIREQLGDALDEPFVYVSGLVAGGAGLIGSLMLIFLYTFLFLLYRSPIYHFILGQFDHEQRERIELVLADTQHMSYTYLKGLLLVMLILGLLNSIGLMAIGIEYAFFWGFFAAFLAIIPYVGTFIGGLLPFLYTLSTTDTLWQPVAVIVLFAIVQTVEGNIITPKVVGSSIRVNPLAAIIALFFGGFLWGVEGLIIALPLMAILRIFLVHSTSFRPFGLLLSDDLVDREAEFLGLLDEPHYRVVNFFRVQRQKEIVSAQSSVEATDQVSSRRSPTENINRSGAAEIDVDVEVKVATSEPTIVEEKDLLVDPDDLPDNLTNLFHGDRTPV